MTTHIMQSEMPRFTEAAIVALLRKRYGARHAGNGQNYAYEHAHGVRTNSMYTERVADFIAMDMSSYRGHPLHGHEIKVSRADWLVELKDPGKAEAFKPYMDYWWLVTADLGVARVDELPEGWGLMTATATRLRVVRAAPKLDPAPMPKTMMASFIRSAVKQAVVRRPV